MSEDHKTNPKQVLVVRTKYPDGKGGFFKPRTGKLIAQGAHASMKVFFDRIKERPKDMSWIQPGAKLLPMEITILLDGPMAHWVFGSFTKIVVGCDSEQELLDLKAKAEAAGVVCALIVDNGYTEFHGVPTATVLAVGPDAPDRVDAITGGLKLL